MEKRVSTTCHRLTQLKEVLTSKYPTTFSTIKQVDDFTYLGSYIMDSEKDFKFRKALAWAACNELNKIWHSSLANEQKRYLFNSLIEPILLYESETWTLTVRQQQRLQMGRTPAYSDASKTPERI